MTYSEIFANGIGEASPVFGDNVIETATLDENINGDGGLTLGWNAMSGGVLPAGMEVGDFILTEPYAPTRNSDGSYRYDVKFHDPAVLLSKQLFYRVATDTEGNPMTLYTFTFVGYLSTIMSELQTVAGVNCELEGSVSGNETISVSFDGDTIKGAAQKIADACGEPLWFTAGTMHIGSPAGALYLTGEYYTRFVILGGTKNMGKRIQTSEGMEYAAVTQRLTLDKSYRGSILSNGGNPPMTKMLIFDEIYPKVVMEITSARKRDCYVLDENGEKIVDHYEKDGATVSSDTEGATAIYKLYAKWYVTLGNVDGEAEIDQEDIESTIIDGTVLRMQFLPRTENGNSALAGREFELVHFTEDVEEWEEDDVRLRTDKFMAHAGDYRIVMTADGSTVLPATEILVPAVGDLVSLVNIVVPEACYDTARARLLTEGMKAVAAYNGEPTSYQEQYPTLPSGVRLGESLNGYIVTSIQTDLITQAVTVTYGTLAQRGKVSSMADKIDSVALSGGGGTKSEPVSNQKVYTMSEEQWKALARAGGNRGIVTVNRRFDEIDNQLQNFGTNIANVQSQADQRMEIWFGDGIPHPNSATDSQTSDPASSWTTEVEKRLHVEDLYYNTNREAANQYGGRAWRWAEHTINGTSLFYFDEVTDADTILSLEKVADVAYDGKLSGGSEKVRVYGEWMRAVENYKKHLTMLQELGGYADVNVADYDEWYKNLAWMLNGGVVPQTTADQTSLVNGTTTPAWLSDLNVTTDILFSSTYVMNMSDEYDLGYDGDDDMAQCSRELYRYVWNTYYEKLTAIEAMFKRRANEAYHDVRDIADDGIITAGMEKSQLLTLWRETVSEYAKYKEQAEDYDLDDEQDEVVNGSVSMTPYHNYINRYYDVARMLNGFSAENINSILNGSALPSWLDTDYNNDTVLSENSYTYNGSTITLTAALYRQAWGNYHAARAAILKAIQEAAQAETQAADTKAQRALDAISSITQDGWLDLGELPSLKREFETAYREREKMVTLATDGSTHKLLDGTFRQPLDNYLASFKTLVAYMQMTSTNWSEPATYTVNNGSGVSNNDATYLVAAKIPLADGDFPALLKITGSVRFLSDWSDSTSEDGGATFRNLWAGLVTNQTNLSNAVATLAKDTADQAQADATDALDKLTEIASDSRLDPAEKIRVKTEFLNLWNEKDNGNNCIVNRVNAYGSGVIDMSAYITAFNLLGTYLNAGDEWTGASSWREASYRSNDENLPSWLQSDSMSRTENINPTTWRSLWSNLYTERTGVLTALSKKSKDLADSAQTSANSALTMLGKIADDGWITQNEKNDLLKQWKAWAAEYATLSTAKESPDIEADAEWGVYQTAIYRLYHFLDDLTDSADTVNVSASTPRMLSNGSDTQLTNNQATLYTTVLTGFLAARTSLLSGLSTGKLSYWVSESLPESGFRYGDRCLWQNHEPDGGYESGVETMMFCIKDYDNSYQYNPNTDGTPSSDDNWNEYWQEAATVIPEIENDPRRALASLADRLFTLYGSDSAVWPITVDLSEVNANAVTLNSNSSVSDSSALSVLDELRRYIGDVTFHIYLTSTGNAPSGVTLVEYDLLCYPVTFTIPNSNEKLRGGVRISMYNGSSWEYLQESTSSLLESLGNKILAIVFGSNAAATEASGLDVGQRFAKLFSMAQVWDTTANNGQGGYVTLAQALFGIEVEPSRYVNITDSSDIITAAAYAALSAQQQASYAVLSYSSSAKISADKINLTASNIITLLSGSAEALAQIGLVIKHNGSNGAIILGTYVETGGNTVFKGISINADGNVTNVEVDADSINFKTGTFSIKDNDNNETFGIGSDGKVRMNDATIQGSISAESLVLEEEAEIPNLIARSTVSRDENNNVYSRIRGGDFQIGTFTENNGEYTYTPRYNVGLATKTVNGNVVTYPVIRFIDEDGNLIGQLDETFFTQVEDVADTWEMKNLGRVGNVGSSMAWADISGQTGSPRYKYTSGYQLVQGVRQYHNQSANGKWFTEMNTGTTLLNGRYVECVTHVEYRTRLGVYQRRYCRYYLDIENGVETGNGKATSTWSNVDGGTDIED